VKAELGLVNFAAAEPSRKQTGANVISRLSNSALHLHLGGGIIVESRDSL
jgi:hypothetical protein